jgi:hypothetical protein
VPLSTLADTLKVAGGGIGIDVATKQVAENIALDGPPDGAGRSTVSSMSPLPEAAQFAPPPGVQVQLQSDIPNGNGTDTLAVAPEGPSEATTI